MAHVVRQIVVTVADKVHAAVQVLETTPKGLPLRRQNGRGRRQHHRRLIRRNRQLGKFTTPNKTIEDLVTKLVSGQRSLCTLAGSLAGFLGALLSGVMAMSGPAPIAGTTAIAASLLSGLLPSNP